MLTLSILNEEQTCCLYEERMRQDFPPSELKHLSSILTMVKKGVYDVIGAYNEQGHLTAYALLYAPADEGAVLLDYLAVDEPSRGKGIGTRFLSQLREYYRERADVLLIECERPKSAPDEQEARKRIRFYAKAGAVLTSVRVWLFGVEYSIMVLPCDTVVPKKDWAGQMLQMYRQMLPKALFDANVRLIRE